MAPLRLFPTLALSLEVRMGMSELARHGVIMVRRQDLQCSDHPILPSSPGHMRIHPPTDIHNPSISQLHSSNHNTYRHPDIHSRNGGCLRYLCCMILRRPDLLHIPHLSGRELRDSQTCPWCARRRRKRRMKRMRTKRLEMTMAA